MCLRDLGASRLRITLLVLTLVVATLVGQVPAQAAGPYFTINGSGTVWAQDVFAQWRAAEWATDAMTVYYSGIDTAGARRAFIAGSADYAVSEMPFQTHPEGAAPAEDPTRPYAYVPIAAGGLSFMYNLKIGGVQVADLRLSGETITRIFTGGITNWDDPAIQADNPGLVMPNKLLTPVMRNDCSSTTAQLTAWMSSEYPSLWQSGSMSCFPSGVKGATYENGSNGVSSYVSLSYGEGAITYVEKSYAIKTAFPVAKVLNAAGYYVAPTADAVAIALTGARLNTDHTQDLAGVYGNIDRRAYPLSSYAYLIVPTAVDPVQVVGGFTADKGHTLAAFARYAVCAGQGKADQLGYAPLPLNLVTEALAQIQGIPGVDVGTDLAGCTNPTFLSSDSPADTQLLRNAAMPAVCDQKGACAPAALIAVAVTITASSSAPAAGAAVTLTAHLNPGVSGNVAFMDNGTTLGTVASSAGVATLTTSVLTTGAHTIIAVYSGDATYSAATSSATTVTVSAGSGGGSGGPGTPAATVASDGAFTLIAPDSTSPANLSNPTIDAAGRSVSTGTLGQFTVVDERAASKLGWSLSVTVDDFVNGTTVVPGSALGIKPTTPLANANSGPGVPVLGSEKLAGQATSGWTFAQLAAGQYDAAAVFDADLTFVAPAGTPPGIYVSRISITLISN
jgi:ABC-type phosphate transport system substrate-binding protein